MIRGRVEEFNAQKQSPRVAQEALFLDQIHISLQKPIHERCEDVRKMIDEFPIKDLHVLYPHLLASIFSEGSGRDWGLHTPHSRSLEGFRRFLGPHGPVWSLVEKLDRDSFLRYEFPVTCLPKATQRLFVEGIVPALYYNKIHFAGGSTTSWVLSLGAVEYFLFQFAYYITQNVSPWDNARAVDHSHETIFTALFTDYLGLFLPTHANIQNLEHRTHQPKFPPKRYFNSNGDVSPLSFSGLIKSFEKNRAAHPRPSVDHASHVHARHSELFLQIFTELWLNVGGIEGREGSPLFSSFAQDYFLPSVDHVRVVRMLVKHLHLFVNVNLNATSPEMDKASYRAFMPDSIKLFKKRLYWFIHHCFAHWPLDPSFRFILETWLSYIQPWRYLNAEQEMHHKRNSRGILFWKPFIHHNLLFYTVLLQEFLNRAEKLNLRSSRDTHLFYRVTKVFSQEHLMYIVNEAEHQLLSCLTAVQAGFVRGKPRSPKPDQYVHFMELQVPGSAYRPLWSEENINNINAPIMGCDEKVVEMKCGDRTHLSGLHVFEGVWCSPLCKGPDAELDARLNKFPFWRNLKKTRYEFLKSVGYTK